MNICFSLAVLHVGPSIGNTWLKQNIIAFYSNTENVHVYTCYDIRSYSARSIFLIVIVVDYQDLVPDKSD